MYFGMWSSFHRVSSSLKRSLILIEIWRTCVYDGRGLESGFREIGLGVFHTSLWSGSRSRPGETSHPVRVKVKDPSHSTTWEWMHVRVPLCSIDYSIKASKYIFTQPPVGRSSWNLDLPCAHSIGPKICRAK